MNEDNHNNNSSTIYELFYHYPSYSFSLIMCLFGLLGYLIVTRYLMEKQIRSFLPKTIFTLTFMCSVGLLAMYMYEISLISIPEIFWDIILSIQVFMCLLVIPICLLLRLPYVLYRIKIVNFEIPLPAICLILSYLKILSYWSSEIKSKKSIQTEISMLSKMHINILLEIVVNYGVYIMAFMSAYGAIWCPYIYFNHIDTQKQQLAYSKKKTKQEIHFIIEQIKNNKYQILLFREKEQELNRKIQQKKQQKASYNILVRSIKSLTSFGKNAEFNEIEKIHQKLEFYRKQLQTLHRVHQESFSIYKQIIDEERKHLISSTWTGKLFRLFSLVLCAYSISRFVLTAFNMIKGRKLSTDPITRLLNFITIIWGQNLNDTFRSWSQYISFGFMGYLMISSVRSFSINMKNFFDFIFRRHRLNLLETDTLVLFLSQMYGIYFLSAVILLQSSLPRTYVTNFEHLTGQVRLVEHFTLFDKLFFWCCITSTIFIFICQWQRKQKMHYIIQERNVIDLN